MLRRFVNGRPDRGEGASSYFAAILLIALVVAVLAGATVPDKIVGAVSNGVCKVAGDDDCAGPGASPRMFRQQPAAPSDTPSSTPSTTPPSTPSSAPSSVPAESPEQREYREAKDAYERAGREADTAEREWSAFDLARELAALGLDFLIGDIKKCIEDPSFGDCLWALLNLVPWSKLGTFIKSIPKLVKLVDRFIELQNRVGRLRKARGDAKNRLDDADAACKKTKACGKSLKEIAQTADLSSPRDGALFWTGLPEAEANRIAGGMTGQTLEQTMRQRGVALPPWKPDDPELSEAWEIVSKRFAQQASGEVRLIAGPNPRPNSDWLMVELPALKENPNVTRIVQIDAKTGAETIIFER